LIHELQVHEILVLQFRRIAGAESLLVSRFLMIQLYIFSCSAGFAESMCHHAAQIHDRIMDWIPKVLRRMDDCTFMMEMKNNGGYAFEIAKRLDERKLFKKSVIY